MLFTAGSVSGGHKGARVLHSRGHRRCVHGRRVSGPTCEGKLPLKTTRPLALDEGPREGRWRCTREQSAPSEIGEVKSQRKKT